MKSFDEALDLLLNHHRIYVRAVMAGDEKQAQELVGVLWDAKCLLRTIHEAEVRRASIPLELPHPQAHAFTHETAPPAPVPREAPVVALAVAEDLPPMSETNEKLAQAADAFDWAQPHGRDWNPCFALMEDGRFCGRAQRWAGHEDGHDHPHVGLAALLDQVVEKCAVEFDRLAISMDNELRDIVNSAEGHVSTEVCERFDSAAAGYRESARRIRALRRPENK